MRIKDLVKELRKASKAGYEYIIFSQDEEGNGFMTHAAIEIRNDNDTKRKQVILFPYGNMEEEE